MALNLPRCRACRCPARNRQAVKRSGAYVRLLIPATLIPFNLTLAFLGWRELAGHLPRPEGGRGQRTKGNLA
jgi:hypothetical protein